MRNELLRSTLYSIMIYLTCGTFNPALAATQPFGGSATHVCGVIGDQWNKQDSDQFLNRYYARTSVANLSVGEPRTVRVIYFLPNDRQPQPDIDTKIDRLIKDGQQSYAEVMENHGFGRKTFRLETDIDGKVVVHHVNGRFSDAYYHTDTYNKVVWQETTERFDLKHNIYLIVLDVSNAVIDGYCGQAAATGPEGGGALIPAPNSRLQSEHGWGCFNVAVAAHELGHGFGLGHDRLKNANRKPSSYHADLMTSSFCAAEWLDVHRYFNFGQTYPEQDKKTTIQMSPPLASSPNAIRLHFEITDADGLQQAQLFSLGDVIGCKRLNGQREMYEFEFIPALHGIPKEVKLSVIDRRGNFTTKSYPINIASLLPPPKVISIPDTKLAAVIRKELKLATGDSFTQWNLTELRSLDASNHGISDLTGLEHATQLQALTLSGNGITDISGLASLEILENLNLSQNKITNIGVLGNMTNLARLNLQNNSISDISAIAGLPNLLWLNLDANLVSDISAVTALTNLTSLFLGRNSISDISPLTGLTNLTWLDLDNNSVSDISAVAGLTNLTSLFLGRNSISDISEVSGLVNLTRLFLWNNSISDLSPLIANKGLERGDMVNVVGNPLSYLSIHTHIPTLQSRGVTVEFDNQVDRGPDKITGPWLWMIAPTAPGQGGAQSNNIDSLAAASNGHVAEAGVAANGAREGDTVGNYVWTLGTITATGRDNINDVINAIGMARGNVDHHSSYALITLESITAQPNVTMWVGSDDSIKVWLNGEVVHNNPIDRGATDFQDRFTVNLKQGENLLLVKVSEGRVDWSMFVGIEADVNAVYKRPPDPVVSADVNRDGVVNILDLIVIASSLGQSGQSDADVNGDRVVSILDLVLAAGMFEEAATAPSAQPQVPETLTAVEVQNWLTNAMSLEVKDPIAKKGIIVLEQLLIFLTPTETELLANYPNPFNPETWIPYRLAEEAFVTLTIYDLNGQIVRTIDVGHQTAAVYETRLKAVCWNGRNESGESVASGMYFYHLSAGDYSATRRMVILK